MGQIILRQHFTEVPVTSEVIHRVYQLAEQEKMEKDLNFQDHYLTTWVDRDDTGSDSNSDNNSDVDSDCND